MQRKTIYLCLPITGHEKSSRELAKKAQQYYENRGFIVNNPHEIYDELTKALERIPTLAEIQAADLDYLAQSDAMILFPNWELSQGCNIEIYFANAYGIEIYLPGEQGKRCKFNSAIKNKLTAVVTDRWILRSVKDQEPIVGLN